MAGWIKIHRDLIEHWLAQDMEKLGRWIDLLMIANYEDAKVLVGKTLHPLQRGQMVVSCSYLANRWNCSKSTVSEFLNLLESDNMITRVVERKTTILTICNYESYQQRENATPNDSRTIAERCPNETKKNKEEQEYNIISNAHTHEDEYISKYREEGGNGMWINVAMMLHLKSPEECVALFDRFVMEQQHNGETHPSYKEFKSHFLAWARIAITKEQKQNGNNRPDYSKRGRADVPSDISLDF